MMNKILCVAALAATMCACSNDEYKLYDTTQKDQVFIEYYNSSNKQVTSVDYSYGYDIATVHTIEIPVTLMGMPKTYDRAIKVVPVAEETTMVEGTHYTIDESVLPANEVKGTIRVNLLRDKDPEIQEREFTLKLVIEENEDLRTVGQNEFTITYSDIRPTLTPSWWVTWAGLPNYSFEAAQDFFDYFYRLAPVASPDVFNEIITAYGDYFVNAKLSKGPMSMYTNFLKNYVLIPMYNDLKDKYEWQSVPSM
jgi:hypothetical protein